MAMVNFWYNTRAKYNTVVKDPETLYFCKDTREFFKGSELYTEAVRFVDNYENLPMLAKAASGVIYFCLDKEEGYVINRSTNEWVRVNSNTTTIEVDDETIEVNSDGLISVKAIDIPKVNGLEERLSNIESSLDSGTPFVLNSQQFTIDEQTKTASISNIGCGVVMYNDKPLNETLNQVINAYECIEY